MMTPGSIYGELKDRNITQAAIAAEAGVTPSHISSVLKGHRQSTRILRLISRKLSIPYADLKTAHDRWHADFLREQANVAA